MSLSFLEVLPELLSDRSQDRREHCPDWGEHRVAHIVIAGKQKLLCTRPAVRSLLSDYLEVLLLAYWGINGFLIWKNILWLKIWTSQSKYFITCRGYNRDRALNVKWHPLNFSWESIINFERRIYHAVPGAATIDYCKLLNCPIFKGSLSFIWLLWQGGRDLITLVAVGFGIESSHILILYKLMKRHEAAFKGTTHLIRLLVANCAIWALLSLACVWRDTCSAAHQNGMEMNYRVCLLVHAFATFKFWIVQAVKHIKMSINQSVLIVHSCAQMMSIYFMLPVKIVWTPVE